MRVNRAGDGVRIRLTAAEAHLLVDLLTELEADLDPDALDPADPVRRRLYPAGYAETEAAQAFRQLTESTLRRDRSERVAACLAELPGGRPLRRTEIGLDADGTQRWLMVVNDLRLTLGTRLGISDDDDYALDHRDPQVGLRARYLWLTALQDLLVTTVMG
jgi:hypothetical protein